MVWKQTTTPNINVGRTPGLCLAYVCDSVEMGFPRWDKLPATAQQAWELSERRIDNAPTNVFTVHYASITTGEYAGMGHVWLEKEGRAYDANGDWPSRDALFAYLHPSTSLQYLGWSSVLKTECQTIKICKQINDKKGKDMRTQIAVDNGGGPEAEFIGWLSDTHYGVYNTPEERDADVAFGLAIDAADRGVQPLSIWNKLIATRSRI